MASGPIGEKLRETGDLIDNEYDDLVGYVQVLESTVKELKRRLDNVERVLTINHLKGAAPMPPPLPVTRWASDDTEGYSSGTEYKPQHPFFKLAGAQSKARKTYCWLTQSSDDEKNKAKQDKLVQEYYGDKTTDKRREAIIKELIAMAKCKDKCQLQGNAIISAKGCADDAAVREFVMKRLESSEFHDKKTGKQTMLTKRRPRSKTALKSPEGYDAKSFRV
jgi:hypothetical protein